MPRQADSRIRDRSQPNTAAERGQGVQTTVEARQIDFSSGAMPGRGGDLDGLLNGLSSFNAGLKDYADAKDVIDDKSRQDGKHSAARGEDVDKARGEAFVNGYMTLKGSIEGERDKADILQKYDTTFDKENGDLEGFIKSYAADKMKGVPQGAFTAGHQETFSPALLKLRKDHKEYQTKRVVADVESNAVELLTGGIGAYVSAGQPVPQEYRDSIKGYLGANLGVSEARYQDLEFAAVKRLGDEGNFGIYDMFKRPQADGAAGLYFDPAWKEKIDQAQLHATNVFLSRQGAAEKAARAAREDAQDVAMLEVFNAEDPKEATRMFEQHRAAGLFTRASELVKYEKLLTEKVDGKPSINQLDTEMGLLPRALEGNLPLKTILGADITRGQKMGLIAKNKAAVDEARRLAATNANAAAARENSVFNDPLYRGAKDYLSTVLRPRPANDMDFMQVGTPFDRNIQARAEIDYVNAMKTRRPDEATAVAMEIADRYQKQRNNFSPSQRANVAAGSVPFNNIGEAIAAARAGQITPAELNSYTDHFGSQGK